PHSGPGRQLASPLPGVHRHRQRAGASLGQRRAARSVWKRSVDLGIIPVLRKPICQWNNQNWRIEQRNEDASLILPVCQNGQVGQIAIRCSRMESLGKLGVLRIKRKRGKWVADVAYTLPASEPITDQDIMGVDLGVKVPAVVHVMGKG